ncbi:MAG: G8 domain-containing protein [Candidatus Andeanibacterium colombiense]|uniref:G8 domain-containing protein n=1 Tax=Candidatus Andeanibacterium colombiense TaxID=3121345 RepID=A0AAJ5X9D1_9SPHN|nr:MAG: G8 domain-containing protein [Sphingomonadaceae bacterium]
MRRQFGLLISLLLPAALVLGFGAGARAEDAHMHMDMGAHAPVSAQVTRWSDPASWPDGKVPAAGDAVTIGRDRNILLDVNPPALRSLTVSGKLSFSDKLDIALKTEWIYLQGGELEIGTEASPHRHDATITLTDTVPDEDVNTMGDRGIMLMRGTLNLHGDRTNSWTKLSGTAKAGSAQIEVLDASGWRKGDTIVLASTDFDPAQAEERTVAAISGNRLTLDQPLKYMHFGEVTFGVDERGEVGLLSRNIRIQASDDAAKSYFGGHIMAMAGSKMFVSGVELNRMGQNMHLARYPIHWHIAGDGQGQYIRNSSIHDTYSRCVTVHGTDNVLVQNNVTYNTVGHCFFLEDAVETGNQFVHNLGIWTRCHPDGSPCLPTNLGPFKTAEGKNFDTSGQKAKDILIPSDNNVSTFWITNPDNIYRDNVAAGSEQIGFWYALPEHPTGAFLDKDGSKDIWPRRMAVREFKGNTAHSNFDGFMSDRGPTPDGHFTTGGHIALADPADANSAQVATVIEDFTSYKNRNGGMWTRGEMDLFKHLKLADNAIGYTHASANFGKSAYTSRVVDSLFVGETANIGNPATPAERAYGRSLPEPELADFPIRGYEFYDYRHELDNVTFVNFQDNATRKTGAISYLLFTSFGMSTNNTVEHAKFIDAKPVYFPPVEHKWSNDDYGNGTYQTAVFHDLDGSVGGVPDSFILLHDEQDGLTLDPSCELRPSWNAAVCKGDFGRLAVATPGAAGPGIPFGPPGAAKGPPPAPIVLSRNGKAFTLAGDTNIRAGSEIELTTRRPSVALTLSELDSGSWVIFELPGFTAAASGAPQRSLDALRKAGETSYYKGSDALWVKIVSTGQGARLAGPGAGGTSVQVSR